MPLQPDDRTTRLERALLALDGLSLGDAFGEQFFRPEYEVGDLLERRVVPSSPWWPTTDDTAMAIGVVETLAEHGRIDQEALALRFADRYRREPGRGYGGGAHGILGAIATGTPFREAAGGAFGGQGSFGNGAAMRVAPVGAWFADSLDDTVREARLSAEVTHAHPDGQAGGIAVAVAAAILCRWRRDGARDVGAALLPSVLERTPDGPTRRGIERAIQLPRSCSVVDAAHALGTGWNVIAADTVPFCLWVVARHLGLYEAALWTTVSGLGDRDTTGAIVGGLVALHVGREGLPGAWLARRETLDVRI